jgi:N-acetylglutamate synthase-like GNAT family acetyltransferase
MPAFATHPGHPFFEPYLELRYLVLRKPLGLPEGSEQDPADYDTTTRHLVWVEDGLALGCVQLQATPEPGTARVRYMAVDPAAEGQGIGKALMDMLFDLAREEQYQTLSLFARENAVPFYKVCGFALHEEVAPFHGIRHWRMSIQL